MLLEVLYEQTAPLQDKVEIIIGDNCSTDETQAITSVFNAKVPQARVIRHESNVGPEENFCRCLDVVTTTYFWIIGDDDVPKDGVVRRIVNLLETDSPDLLYLNSEWVNPITSSRQGKPVFELQTKFYQRKEFAREVHVWFTFISGMVVNRDTLQVALQQQSIRRFLGTSLVQLGWVFPVLATGRVFIEVRDQCMLATKGNTGGYALLTAFGANFPRATRESFGQDSPLAALLISRTASLYLPGLIWSSRLGSSQRFAAENPWPALRQQLGHLQFTWILLWMIGKLPKTLARVVYAAWRFWRRAGHLLAALSRFMPPGQGAP